MLLLGVITTSVNAQVQFLLQNRTKTNYTKVFVNINDAYNAAQANDTIYLPGSKNTLGFHFDNNRIDKKIHWIGVGTQYPDTPVVEPSIINNPKIIFTANATGSTVEGIRFNELQIGESATKKCNDFILKRCVFRNILEIFGNNCIVTGCFGYNITGSGQQYAIIDGNEVSENCLIRNNLLVVPADGNNYAGFYRFNHSTFSYNTLYSDYAVIHTAKYCTVNNNIFIGTTGDWNNGSYQNLALRVNNCAFSSATLPFDAANTYHLKTIGKNCITGITTADTFESVTPWTSTTDKENVLTQQNLKIKTSSTCKTAGTDGKEIGAYGDDLYAYKSIPFFLHIEDATIGTWTHMSGGTKVIDAKVKVSSQAR